MKIRFLSAILVCAMLLTFLIPTLTATAEINAGEPSSAAGDIERSLDTSYGDFSYQYNDDGTVKITKYNGSGGSVSIPKTINGKKVTSIWWSAFFGCSGLTSVTIPDYVTYIGTDAFSSCTGLTSIKISNSVNIIGQGTFSYCTSLKSITLPNSVEILGPYAFDNCTNLSSVTLSNSMTYIGECAFSRCSALKSVTIPKSVTEIGSFAFADCSGLTTVKIYNSSASIGKSAFRNCSKLTIYGYKDSTAEKHAKSNNIPFVAIDKPGTGKKIYGEIDGDGKITSADSLLILRQSVKLERFTGTKLKLCDVDGDNKVTSADALEVLRYSVKIPTSTKTGKVYVQ